MSWARRRFLRRYFAIFALTSLAWEILQLPLYTLWKSGTRAQIASAIAHCTAGDVLIAAAALSAAALAAGGPDWPLRRFAPVAAIAILIGVAYTICSEWFNVSVRGAWTYTDAMPTIPLPGFAPGVSPVLQWLVVPAFAFWRARAGLGSASFD
jgi:hypothetical protein